MNSLREAVDSRSVLYCTPGGMYAQAPLWLIFPCPPLFLLSTAVLSKLEAAVLDLPGVISCALTPALHGNGENGSGSNGYPTAAPTAAIAGDEGNRYPYASPPYVLEASLSRVPRLPQPAPSTSPSSDSGSDAVWTALREAYDPEGRRKVAGVRDILEAVQGLGYEARLLGAGAGAGGGASAIEFSQARGTK